MQQFNPVANGVRLSICLLFHDEAKPLRSSLLNSAEESNRDVLLLVTADNVPGGLANYGYGGPGPQFATPAAIRSSLYAGKSLSIPPMA